VIEERCLIGSTRYIAPLTAAAVDPWSDVARARPIADLADTVAGLYFPHLSESQRSATVQFVLDRHRVMPSLLRIGITTVAYAMNALLSLGARAPFGRCNRDRRAALVAPMLDRSLPLVSDYLYFVRGLVITYAVDTWPPTAHSAA
jgi:hypothetical protein